MKESAFEILERELGQSSALGILNELIGERMKEEHPEYGELDATERERLWYAYCQKFTGKNAEALLRPYVEENL